MDMQETIEQFRELLLNDLEHNSSYFRSLRHHLHMYPERTTREIETARFISSVLCEYDIEHTCDIAGENGIVAVIKGEAEGPVIALRADMDALEIEEETGLPYSSRNPQIMHACGHDFHMVSVLATGILINMYREHLRGMIKLIFQPAEENGPRGGAKSMIAAGVLDDPHVDAIFASHVFPSLPRHTIWIPNGPVMAAVDNFIITVEGRGGHAAMPQQTIDPIPVAAQLVLALNTLVSRIISPNEQAVVSLGRIEGGNRRNVIPDKVVLEGTMRTVSVPIRKQLRARIHQIAAQIPAAFGASGIVKWFESFGPTINDPNMAELARNAITVPPFSVEMGFPQMTAEDFSSFLNHTRGAFILFGTDEGSNDALHSSRLKIADEVLDEMITMYIHIISKAMHSIVTRQRSEAT
jgi:N-acetylcysteine deacetylase